MPEKCKNCPVLPICLLFGPEVAHMVVKAIKEQELAKEPTTEIERQMAAAIRN